MPGISPVWPSKKRTVRKGVRRAEIPQDSISLARQLGLNVKRIVIDPGHGGKDPGVMPDWRTFKEKNITLSIAKFLAKKDQRGDWMRSLSYPEQACFPSLEQRTAIANMKKADLFISLARQRPQE